MKKLISLILSLLILTTGTVGHANAGPTYWQGNPSYQILTIEENNPIVVEKEELIFDFTGEEYMSRKDYSISSLVTAKYTMSNPTETSKTVQMAFPFISRIRDFNPESIAIKVNGEKIPFEVFIGDELDKASRVEDSEKHTDFNTLVKSITSSEYIPKYYNLDDMGTLYTYDVASTSEGNLNVAITYPDDYDNENDNNKIINKGFNGFHMEDSLARATAWVYDREELELFVRGQEMDFKFNAYSDGELIKETDKYSLDMRTEEMTLREYLTKEAKEFNNSINYLDYLADNQIFNLGAKQLDEFLGNNVFNIWIDDFFSFDYMERYFVLIYEVDFEANSTNDVSVSYITKGTMDRRETAEPIHTFDYILNPASNWAAFKDLNIEIKPPIEHPYIIDSSVSLIRKDDGTYTGNFESLPEEDLSFSLYFKEEITLLDKIKGSIRSNYYLLIFIGQALLGVLVVIITRMIYRRIKKSQES